MSPIALSTPTPALAPTLKPDTPTPSDLPTPPHTPSPATAPAASAQFHMAKPAPVAATSSGLTFTLSDGRQVLDGMSGGAAVACLGAHNPDIVDTMTRQAATLPYTYHQVLGNTPSEELAQFLVSRSGGHFKAAAFLNSGSEAVEASLKLVRQYWVELGQEQRQYVIARYPSYHGNTLGALSAGNVPNRRDIYAPFISPAFHHVPSPTYKRSHTPGETEEAYSARLAAELDSKIQELGPANVAAFYAEPVVGTALGVMPPPRGYFPAIKAVLDKHDILLVMDEVMCGAGRSGALYAWQCDAVTQGVRPDIQSMAKGLGAGYVTISAILVAERVHAAISAAGVWKNSHTYQNHPINCAVALAVLRKMEAQNLCANVTARGAQLVGELRAALAGTKTLFDVRGQGLFIGIEFDAPQDLAPRFALRVKARCFDNGLVTLGMPGTVDGYTKGDSVVLAPAYIVSADEISRIVQIVAQSVREVEAEAQL